MHEVRLIGRRLVAQDTLEFSANVPENFEYVPGQYVAIQLPELTADAVKDYRYLSVANDPREGCVSFVVRLRERSSYKRLLEKLPFGSLIRMTKPKGSLQLLGGAGPVAWYAGGVGVAPFMSALRYWAATREHELPFPVILLYANRTMKSSAYAAELQGLAERFINFRVVFALSREEPGGLPVSIGRLTSHIIRSELSDLKTTKHFIIGGHAFLSGVKDALVQAGSSRESITHEVFCGYCDSHPGVCCCTLLKDINS